MKLPYISYFLLHKKLYNLLQKQMGDKDEERTMRKKEKD